MDFRCPACKENLRWRRLVTSTAGLNGVEYHPARLFCPFCSAEIERNTYRAQSIPRYLIFSYFVALLFSGFIDSEHISKLIQKIFIFVMFCGLTVESIILYKFMRYRISQSPNAQNRAFNADPAATA